MIPALTLLLACQLVGEILTRTLHLPVPGPVLGLALLTAGLWVHTHRRDTPPEAIEATPLGRLATALLANLGLFFVPAGAGVVGQFSVLGTYGAGIFTALLLSTVLALLATVATFRLAKRLLPR